MPHLFEIEKFANLENTSELVTAREWTQGGEEIEETPQLLIKLQGAVLKKSRTWTGCLCDKVWCMSTKIIWPAEHSL